jgi:Flp pilus assembly protein CpaB
VPLPTQSRLSRPLRLSRLTRSPFTFWLAVAGLALTTALVVAQAVGRANSLAGHYGPLRPVVVASRAIDGGVEVKAADLAVRQVPARFRTEGSFEAVAQVEGRVAVRPLVAGEPVLRAHLARDGLAGVAALLPPGTRAVAVPTGSASPPLRTGDIVDLLATFEDDPAVAVALEAPVVDVGPDKATVAVTPAEAGAVALAISRGAVTVALTPGVSARR